MARIDARVIFLPVESFWPFSGKTVDLGNAGSATYKADGKYEYWYEGSGQPRYRWRRNSRSIMKPCPTIECVSWIS
jgi:hypothetical protein